DRLAARGRQPIGRDVAELVHDRREQAEGEQRDAVCRDHEAEQRGGPGEQQERTDHETVGAREQRERAPQTGPEAGGKVELYGSHAMARSSSRRRRIRSAQTPSSSTAETATTAGAAGGIQVSAAYCRGMTARAN